MRQKIVVDYNFRDKVDVKELNEQIESITSRNPHIDYVINIPSTIGVSSSFVEKLHPKVKIRIAGGYDKERLEGFKEVKYDNGEDCNAAYFDSVIYTRNETIKILREIEEIEKGIQPNWSDIQKTLYIYDKLKTTIMYDPKYMTKPSSEVRSLRGLITKQTVCAGYALILQEILERNGIQCMFVVSPGHAWNVITIDDEMYGVDLTSDNYAYRHGQKYTHMSFGQNETDFTRGRIPVTEERNKSFLGKLRTLNTETIEKIAETLVSETDYEATASIFTRNDGSRFYLAQVGTKSVQNGKMISTYRKYYYRDINADGTYGEAKILYAYIDVFTYLNQLNHGEGAPSGYGHAITNVLFSKENIRNSELRNSGYLGEELIPFSNIPVIKTSEINKSYQDIRNTQNLTRTFTRRDNTKVIVEYVDTGIVNGKTVYEYRVFEMLPGKKKKTVKSNEIFSEENLLTTRKKNIGDNLLKRTRLDKKAKESGGYIGYLDDQGQIRFNQNRSKHFSRNKRVTLPDYYPNRPIILPSFKELEDLARTYEIVNDTNKNEIYARNIKTKKKVESDRLNLKAIFANIWLVSAGTEHNKQDQRKGVKKAFDEDSKRIYNKICSKINSYYSYYSYIDTVEIYKELSNEFDTQAKKIFVTIFQNQFQSEYTHRLFYNAQTYKRATRMPEVLKNIDYADRLAYGNRMRY